MARTGSYPRMFMNRTAARSPRDRPGGTAVSAWLPGLGGALAAGLALRIWLATRAAGITMDSPLYVRMAEWLRGGPSVDGPAHHGYSALIALASLVVPGREWPGRVVSLAAGLALIAVVRAIAQGRGPETREEAWRGAALAAWLVALHPLLAIFSSAIMTESTFLALAYAGLLLTDRERPFAGGVVLGLGYVVRPEAAVLAVGAALFGRRGRPPADGRTRGRAFLLVLGGFLLVGVPYVSILSALAGSLTVTPKVALVHAQPVGPGGAEWRLTDARGPRPAVLRTFAERVRDAAPSVTRNYLPNLAGHLKSLLEVWPVPLMLLSLAGLARGGARRPGAAGPGPLIAPFLVTAVLPFLVVPFDARFALLQVPALAVGAAWGAGWIAGVLRERGSVPARAGASLALILAIAGLAWCWSSTAGWAALHFDDVPVANLRAAGDWLRAHGRPGAVVMDRKAYVPFFAGMRHVQLPDDPYDDIVEGARSSGVDYLVVEEWVVASLRPQLAPLLADPAFRAAERRLRPLYAHREAPGDGIAIFEVVRDSTRAGR
jgi:hypothetical protein